MRITNLLLATSIILSAVSCGGNSNNNTSSSDGSISMPSSIMNSDIEKTGDATTAKIEAQTLPPLSFLSDAEASSAASKAKNGTVYYVNKNEGNNRNDGLSASNAFKNLQKAIDSAPEGATILVAEGNYIGTLDCGNINITKPLSIIGGFSYDFSKRDILKYQTTVQLNSTASGTAKGQGIMTINVNAEGKTVSIDGIIFNQGNAIAYNPKREGQPAGVETPMMQPVGAAGIGGPDCTEQRVFTNRMSLLYFQNPTANICVSNCAFVNGSNYGILGGFKGKAIIKNNIFVNIVMAAVDIHGTYNSMVNRSVVEFDHNSVLFTWSRTKAMEDMGYGLRLMPCTDYYCTNNIFAFSSFSGLDRTHIDSNAEAEKKRICTSINNLFCLNKQADLTLPGGGMFLRVKAEDFDDVDVLNEVKGNKTIKDASIFNNRLDVAYANGFLTASYTETTDYDPNSTANQWRSSMGMNQVGTMQSTATMFANRYNLQKALLFFGAVNGQGAQTVK